MRRRVYKGLAGRVESSCTWHCGEETAATDAVWAHFHKQHFIMSPAPSLIFSVCLFVCTPPPSPPIPSHSHPRTHMHETHTHGTKQLNDSEKDGNVIRLRARGTEASGHIFVLKSSMHVHVRVHMCVHACVFVHVYVRER